MEDDDNVIELKGVGRDRLDDVLARRRRIRRRQRNVPQHQQAELRRRHPIHLLLPAGFQLRVRRGRWRKLSEYQDTETVRVRTTHAWIVRGREKVGAIELQEIDAELVGDWAFWDQMDADSAEFTGLAEALLSCWPFLEEVITCYGRICCLDYVWLENRRGVPTACLSALDVLLSDVRNETAIFVTRLFPTQYGGRVPNGSAPSNVGFSRRLAAMERVATRALGLSRLPTLLFEGRRDTEVYLFPDAGHCAPTKLKEIMPIMSRWLTRTLAGQSRVFARGFASSRHAPTNNSGRSR